jgi:hypothetical protein
VHVAGQHNGIDRKCRKSAKFFAAVTILALYHETTTALADDGARGIDVQ